MSKKLQLLATVSRLVSFLDKLSDEQLEEIERGTSEVRFKFGKKVTPHINIEAVNRKGQDTVNLLDAVNEINTMKDRQDVEYYLSTYFPSRLALSSIAKLLDIPVSKKDNIEHIRSKIIEGTIGFKLRSQAIQTSGSTRNEL